MTISHFFLCIFDKFCGSRDQVGPLKDLEALIKTAANAASPMAWGEPGGRLAMRTVGTGTPQPVREAVLKANLVTS